MASVFLPVFLLRGVYVSGNKQSHTAGKYVILQTAVELRVTADYYIPYETICAVYPVIRSSVIRVANNPPLGHKQLGAECVQ